MSGYRDIHVHQLWLATTIPAGTTITSDVIDLGTYAQNYDFSIQVEVSGAGTSVCMGYLLSNDRKSFIRSSDSNKIATGSDAFHDKCGVDKNGKDLIRFTPVALARFMKIEAWESLGANDAVLTSHLGTQ